MEIVLGLDGGGTKTEIALVARDGQVVRFLAGPGLDPMAGDWEARLAAMATGLGPVRAAVLGLPYFSEVAEISARQQAVASRLFGTAAQVRNDVDVAFEGALGGQDGVLILAGTGSMAWARGAAGTARAGGFGDAFGDEGSANWIGRIALNLVSRHLDGPAAVGEFCARDPGGAGDCGRGPDRLDLWGGIGAGRDRAGRTSCRGAGGRGQCRGDRAFAPVRARAGAAGPGGGAGGRGGGRTLELRRGCAGQPQPAQHGGRCAGDRAGGTRAAAGRWRGIGGGTGGGLGCRGRVSGPVGHSAAKGGKERDCMMMSVTETVIRDQFPWWEAALAMEVPRLAAGTVVVTGCGTSYYLAQTLACAYNAAGAAGDCGAGGGMGAATGELSGRYARHSGDRPVAVGHHDRNRAGHRGQPQARGWPTFAVSCVPDVEILQAADRGLYVPTDPREGIVMSVSASLMLLAGLRMVGIALAPTVVRAAEAGLRQIAAAVAAADRAAALSSIWAPGRTYGIATEGGLKLQEMSISYSQSFHPMEYRHGPISLIDDGSLRGDALFRRHTGRRGAGGGGLQAKGARVIGFGGPGDLSIAIAESGPGFGLACLPALQMLGEMVALSKGINSEAPRHLTKVVVLDNG